MIALEHEPDVVQKHIEEDPLHPGPADVRLKKHGIHVWALVAQLEIEQFDLQRVACDFAVPVEAVEAAVAYYERHREVLDGRLLANG